MASILDILQTQGSVYSYDNGQTPPTNPGATKQSLLHVDNVSPGYSLDGSDFSTVNAAYQAYNDGDVTNVLPPPSGLDAANGYDPTVALSDPNYPAVNNTFAQGQYELYHFPPGEVGHF